MGKLVVMVVVVNQSQEHISPQEVKKIVWKNEKGKGGQSRKDVENICYRDGGKGHW